MFGEHEQPEIPTFIKAVPDMEGHTDNLCKLFDFWSPDRLGDDAVDYAAGRQHFATAVAYSTAIGSNLILANIIGAMRLNPIGSIELGFIDGLASKASFGRVPPPMRAIDIENTIRETTLMGLGTTEDEMRQGEADAAAFLDIARDLTCVEVISGLLIDAIKGQYGYGALTFIFTICGAAQAGAAH